jgi:MFS family permease
LSHSVLRADTAPDRYPLDPRRYYVFAVFWAALFLFWMAWIMEAPLLVSYWGVVQHVSFSNAEYLVTGVNLSGLATVLLAGYFYDRLGGHRTTTICLAIMTVGFGLRPFAVNSFPLMLVLTIVGGLGFTVIVGVPVVAAKWFGGHRMTWPLALLFSAFGAGQTVGTLMGARMVADLGARWAFGVVSIALVAVLVVWTFLVPREPAQLAGPDSPERAPLIPALRQLIMVNGIWKYILLGAFVSGGGVFANSFLPGTLIELFRLGPVDAGDAASLIPGVSVFGMLLLGAFARRTGKAARYGIATSAIQVAGWILLASLWASNPNGMSLTFTLIVLAVLGFAIQVPLTFAVTALEEVDGITPSIRGAASGFYFTGVAAGGYVFPTILANRVTADGLGAGFWGLVALFTISLGFWCLTRVGARTRVLDAAAAPVVLSEQAE